MIFQWVWCLQRNNEGKVEDCMLFVLDCKSQTYLKNTEQTNRKYMKHKICRRSGNNAFFAFQSPFVISSKTRPPIFSSPTSSPTFHSQCFCLRGECHCLLCLLRVKPLKITKELPSFVEIKITVEPSERKREKNQYASRSVKSTSMFAACCPIELTLFDGSFVVATVSFRDS